MKRVVKDGEREREVELRPRPDGQVDAVVDGEAVAFEWRALADGRLRVRAGGADRVARVTRAGKRVFITLDGREHTFEVGVAARRARRDDGHAGALAMPMPGLVVRVHVREGEQVTRGQALVVVEAMKMEHTLRAPRDGVVRHLKANAGVMVDAGAALLEVEG